MSYKPSGKHTVDGNPWWNPKVEPPKRKRSKQETEPAEADDHTED